VRRLHQAARRAARAVDQPGERQTRLAHGRDRRVDLLLLGHVEDERADATVANRPQPLGVHLLPHAAEWHEARLGRERNADVKADPGRAAAHEHGTAGGRRRVLDGESAAQLDRDPDHADEDEEGQTHWVGALACGPSTSWTAKCRNR
jgi:hypothetical protein